MTPILWGMLMWDGYPRATRVGARETTSRGRPESPMAIRCNSRIARRNMWINCRNGHYKGYRG